MSAHTDIINIILLTPCHSDLFQPSKGYRQGVRQPQFDSKVKKKNELTDVKFNYVGSMPYVRRQLYDYVSSYINFQNFDIFMCNGNSNLKIITCKSKLFNILRSWFHCEIYYKMCVIKFCYEISKPIQLI